MTTFAAPHAAPAFQLHRIEIRPKPGQPDPRAGSLLRAAAALGINLDGVETASVYLVEGAFGNRELHRIVESLLSNPVTELGALVTPPPRAGASIVEVHPLPGVMDPAAQSVQDAIRDLLGVAARVSTGVRYDLVGLAPDAARDLARRVLANPVVHQITTGPYRPMHLPSGHDYTLSVRHIAIRGLTDEQLVKMSREAHLFLSLDEMRAIQAEYRTLEREPTDIELETLAQTWSEHCVHKTLKSVVRYREEGTERRSDGATAGHESSSSMRSSSPPLPRRVVASSLGDRPGHTMNADGSVTIKNLLKSTIAAATHELMADGIDWTLSVFKDNSGVVALDEAWAVNIKVETHNRPSAIEPYGGAATGAGGCIRDVIATGLGARPIANMDVFCVAHPTRDERTLPPGTLHPRRILTDITAGVRDYGNRMGIPTVNGAVAFDDRYVGNPLVFCGCVGLLPRAMIKGEAKAGDRIIALGGRTGRDGIHGATFSSAELESSAATEFAHAVQIGNAIEEKRVLEAIMRARDCDASGDARGGSAAGTSHSLTLGVRPLYNAMTDCGAGGFSSAVGEMGSQLGAEVYLDRAPLKYSGLSYTEIWISEAQERMILAVPAENVPALQRICNEEHVELADLGHFGTPNADLILFYKDTQVGKLPMHFLHEGIPTPTREAVWRGQASEVRGPRSTELSASSPLGCSVASSLLSLLSHPSIASKHWLIRQYDHEVQGNTVVKPLCGPAGRGPSDAAVLEPVPGTNRGVAIASGLQTPVGDPAIEGDPYEMALAAIDECVRNLVCTGADPSRIAILDNFCWPSCEKPENLAALVRACWGCYDGAKAYRTPFVSGKDSLNNQLRYTDPATGQACVIEIPPTLLITGLGIVPSIERATTSDAKRAGNVLVLVGETTGEMGGSIYASVCGMMMGAIPCVRLTRGPATARAVAALIAQGLVASAHDCSEGGLFVALAEMLIGGANEGVNAGGSLGLDFAAASTLPLEAFAFAESPSRYVLEIKPEDLARVQEVLRQHAPKGEAIPLTPLGTLTNSGRLVWKDAKEDVAVRELMEAWRAPLDW